MADSSSIEWTDATWNPVTGCTKVSPGCAHCYAETFAERFRGVPGHHFENGFDVQLRPERLTVPLGWKKPRRVFVNSMSDLFHEAVPFEFVDRVFAVMALTPQHTYQVLTKRPERMREYLTSEVEMRLPVPDSPAIMRPRKNRVWLEAQGLANVCRLPMPLSMDWTWPLPNVWLGVSVENQRFAEIRIPELLATPAAVRFLSCEPLLGPLDLKHYLHDSDCWLARTGWEDGGEPERQWWCICNEPREDHISWVIVGSESGPRRRPMDSAWAASLVGQCRAAGVACFVKQISTKADPKGGKPEHWPDGDWPREMPGVPS